MTAHGCVRANAFPGKRRSGRLAWLLLACSGMLLACASAGGDAESDGALRGELRVFRVDYLDGHSERAFYLAGADETSPQTQLHFANDPGLQPWTKLKVWGTQTRDGGVAFHAELPSAPAVSWLPRRFMAKKTGSREAAACMLADHSV